MLALLPELIVEMRAAAADLERPARLAYRLADLKAVAAELRLDVGERQEQAAGSAAVAGSRGGPAAPSAFGRLESVSPEVIPRSVIGHLRNEPFPSQDEVARAGAKNRVYISHRARHHTAIHLLKLGVGKAANIRSLIAHDAGPLV